MFFMIPHILLVQRFSAIFFLLSVMNYFSNTFLLMAAKGKIRTIIESKGHKSSITFWMYFSIYQKTYKTMIINYVTNLYGI